MGLARFRANLQARSILVHGRVEGNLHGIERVELKKSAAVVDDIYTQRLAIEEGAQLKGSVLIQKDSPGSPERGNSDFDVRQRLVSIIRGICRLAAGASILAEGFVGRRFEGWQVAGVTTFSGFRSGTFGQPPSKTEWSIGESHSVAHGLLMRTIPRRCLDSKRLCQFLQCLSRHIRTSKGIQRSRSRKVCHLRRHARMHRGRLACVVDHMADLAVIAQRHGDHVVEPDLRLFRRLDCPG